MIDLCGRQNLVPFLLGGAQYYYQIRDLSMTRVRSKQALILISSKNSSSSSDIWGSMSEKCNVVDWANTTINSSYRHVGRSNTCLHSLLH